MQTPQLAFYIASERQIMACAPDYFIHQQFDDKSTVVVEKFAGMDLLKKIIGVKPRNAISVLDKGMPIEDFVKAIDRFLKDPSKYKAKTYISDDTLASVDPVIKMIKAFIEQPGLIRRDTDRLAWKEL